MMMKLSHRFLLVLIQIARRSTGSSFWAVKTQAAAEVEQSKIHEKQKKNGGGRTRMPKTVHRTAEKM